MVIPYITFNGDCLAALMFYEDVFNSEVKMVKRYANYIPEGVDSPPDNLAEWILHGEMEICGSKFWFADDVNTVATGNMIRITALFSTTKESEEAFQKLSEGGEVTLRPVKTFYSTFHGAVIDKYGVNWNIVAEESPNQI